MVAALALNSYKTYFAEVTTGITTVYTVPSGVSAIHLYSNVSNTSAGIVTVSVYHERSGTAYEIIKDAKIPTADALEPIGGSLVMEVGDKIQIIGSENSVMKYTLSILESAK
jgi:hypothetical protein